MIADLESFSLSQVKLLIKPKHFARIFFNIRKQLASHKNPVVSVIRVANRCINVMADQTFKPRVVKKINRSSFFLR